MANVGEGDVVIFPTFKGFRAAVTTEVDGSAETAGSRFASIFGSAVKGVGVAIGVGLTAAVAGAGAIAAKGLDRALNIQDAKAQLTGLGHDAESVSTIMESALASVKGTAFGLDQSAKIAASAVASGIKPGEDLTRVLKLTADSATIAQVPLNEMGSIINKVATNQKLTTETMQQFQDRGIPILQAVASQYGVTADEAAGMVSRGEVDFAAFQAALESSVGGAALASGTTARGAFANIGSAFGRMGAMFIQPAVDGAPTLFTAIAGAVDRATTALTPLAAGLGARLTPAIAGLSAWIDTVDFGVVIAGVQRVFDGVSGLYQLVVNGDFTGSLRNAFNLQEDSGFVTFVLSARDAIASFFSSLSSGDLSAATSSIGASLTALQPAFSAVSSELPNIGEAAAKVAGAGITVLTQGLSFLADNVDTIIAFAPLIAAAFVAWRVATSGVVAASMSLQATQLAALPVNIANNALRLQIARTELQVAAATGASTAATNVGIAARIRSVATGAASIAGLVAMRVAQLAGAAASGIATAAQWAFNAALTANPIGLIIAAIVALVAGLIFFFTQTELGQAIWAEFTRFLTEAWANIVAVATVVFTELGNFFTGVWNGIVAVVQFVWALIVGVVKIYIDTVLNIVTTVVNVVVTVWNAAWSAISTFFTTIWNGIVSFISGVVRNVSSAISGLVSGVTSTVQGIFSVIGSIPGTILGLLGNLGTLLLNSGKSLIQGFINGISSMIGAVGDAVGGVMDFIGGFFPNSPAKRGPFSGSGWTRIGKGGEALVDQFTAGMDQRRVTQTLSRTLSASVGSGSSTGSVTSGSTAQAGTGDTYILSGLTTRETAAEIARENNKMKRRNLNRTGALTAAGVG